MPRHRTATLIHEGGSRYVATTGSKRTIVYGDDIERGELSPVETLMVCLAACSAMDVWPRPSPDFIVPAPALLLSIRMRSSKPRT